LYSATGLFRNDLPVLVVVTHRGLGLLLKFVCVFWLEALPWQSMARRIELINRISPRDRMFPWFVGKWITEKLIILLVAVLGLVVFKHPGYS
jgi:hypothetical protein